MELSVQIRRLDELIHRSERIVFFGGAGVSTESGIPDFRSQDGLYQLQYRYPPETILSAQFFEENPREFYRFYYDKMVGYSAEPNAAHVKLAEWERQGKLTAVVTQNIDGLHQAAGSEQVLELHGSVHRNHCTRCGRFFTLEELLNKKPLPYCDCGGLIKPDVVLYGESLNSYVLERSVAEIRQCDLLIVGGTSLAVYPAAGLIDYCHGKIAVVNRDATPADRRAAVAVHDCKIGEVLGKLSL